MQYSNLSENDALTEQLLRELERITEPSLRNPMAEAMAHPMDKDNLEQSLVDAVETTPVPYIREYSNRGSLRDGRDLTEEEQVVADRLELATEPMPNACYRNSKMAAFVSDSFDHEVQYVEGVFTSPNSPQLLTHAWVEVDGAVVDLTLEDDDAIYYGRSFPHDVALKTDGSGRISSDPVVFEYLD